MNKIKKLTLGLISFVFAFNPLMLWAQYSPPTASTTGLPDESLENIIINIMQWMLAVVGFIGIIGFVISGIIYLTSAGDDTKIKLAKTAMTYCIIGVIVALMGYVIIQAADSMLNGFGIF